MADRRRRWWRRWRSLSPLRPGSPWRRFEFAVLLLVAVLAFGTIGYMVVGLGFFDALYQTAITISTVGYGETGPPSQIDRAYRVFTLMLVLAGAGAAVYAAGTLLETLVAGTVNDGFRRRRMQRRVDRMTGHVIVAGWGRVGRSVARYARRRGLDVVAVEVDPEVVEEDALVVIGDATDDDVLLSAGIDRASSLIAALGSDKDNLSLALTARAMRPDLLVVARVAEHRNERKVVRAGANRVVNPYEIGGSRMAAIAFRPYVAEFLDEVIHAEEHDVDIHEIVVGPDSPATGSTLGDVLGPGETAAVIAIKAADGRYASNPPRDRVLATGDVLIAVGSGAQLERLVIAVLPEPPSPSEPPAASEPPGQP